MINPYEATEVSHANHNGGNYVLLGGGGGTKALIGALLHEEHDSAPSFPTNITALVPGFDEGGNSGQLRELLKIDYGVGDGRNALSASISDPLVKAIFSARFSAGHTIETVKSWGNALRQATEQSETSRDVSALGEAIMAAEEVSEIAKGKLEGFSYGNMVLAGLTQALGIEHAFQITGDALGTKADVRVISNDPTRLELLDRLPDGETVEVVGEHEVDTWEVKDYGYVTVQQTGQPKITDFAEERIRQADMVIITPSSPLGNTVPILSTEGLPEAMSRQIQAGGESVCVLNLINDPLQSRNWIAEDYIDRYLAALRGAKISRVIANDEFIRMPEDIRRRAVNIDRLETYCEQRGIKLTRYDLVEERKPVSDPRDAVVRTPVTHSPARTKKALKNSSRKVSRV